MGFSMTFVRVRNGEWVDADRGAARAFLDSRRLHPDPIHTTSAHLLHDDGTPLDFDGFPTDLHVDAYNTDGRWTAGIWHATLSPSEISFVYDLCVAAGLAVVNHQADPLVVIPGGTHTRADLAGIDDAPVFVDSAEELARALSGGFEHFVDWRDRALRPE